MTLITHERYGFTKTGIFLYFGNRILKLYPLYIGSILFTIVLITYLPSNFYEKYHPTMFLPGSLLGWLSNLSIIFGLGFKGFEITSRLTPPAWALTVELFFYLAIGLGVSRTKRITVIWFGMSILYHIIVVSASLSWWWKYFSFLGASLPFSTGAMLYHYRDSVTRLGFYFSTRTGLITLSFFFALNWWVAMQIDWRGAPFYINFAIFSCALMGCMARGGNKKTKRLDTRLGDLSYPLYLIHYQAGLATIFVSSMLGLDLQRPSLELLAITLPVSLLLAFSLSVLIDRPIERLRCRLRPQPVTESNSSKL